MQRALNRYYLADEGLSHAPRYSLVGGILADVVEMLNAGSKWATEWRSCDGGGAAARDVF